MRRKLLYEWREAYRAHGAAGFNRKRGRKVGWQGRPEASSIVRSGVRGRRRHWFDGSPDELARAKARIAELERVIGRQQADLHFFREALRLWDATSPKRRRPHLYAVIQEMIAAEPQGFLQDDANVHRLCALGGVSRAGYYRHFGPHLSARDDADLRDLIQRIALSDRHYGYRRIAVELRRHGLIVNAKRVVRLMREDNLLCLRARAVRPRTTDSRHGFAIAPNLTRAAGPTGLDQIWVADITFLLTEAFSISRSSSTPGRAGSSDGPSRPI